VTQAIAAPDETDAAHCHLKLLSPGLYTLVVDFGRPRSRSLGVPVGGAADRRSLALGNALVGNLPDAAALEICFAGPTLVATAPLAGVVFGAPFDLATGRRPLAAGRTFTLDAGEELRRHGARSAGLPLHSRRATGAKYPR